MAVIHISEAEATKNLLSLMERAHAGEEVRIDTGAGVIAFSRVSPAGTRRKTLTEAIRLAKERNLQILLDDQFERDMDIVLCNHDNAGTFDPWRD